MSNWQYAATACTPSHDSIEADRYTNANGNVRFKENKTGTIHLSCNVDTSVTSIRNLFLTWYEPTGWSDPEYRVSAELKRISKSQGKIQDIVAVGSEGFSGTESIRTRESVPLQPGHTLDHQNHYYYIVITLKRTQVDIDVKAYGVAIR